MHEIADKLKNLREWKNYEIETVKSSDLGQLRPLLLGVFACYIDDEIYFLEVTHILSSLEPVCRAINMSYSQKLVNYTWKFHGSLLTKFAYIYIFTVTLLA